MRCVYHTTPLSPARRAAPYETPGEKARSPRHRRVRRVRRPGVPAAIVEWTGRCCRPVAATERERCCSLLLPLSWMHDDLAEASKALFASVKGRKEKKQGGSSGGVRTPEGRRLLLIHTRTRPAEQSRARRFCLSPSPRPVGRAGRLFRSALHAQIRLSLSTVQWLMDHAWVMHGIAGLAACLAAEVFFCSLLLPAS